MSGSASFFPSVPTGTRRFSSPSDGSARRSSSVYVPIFSRGIGSNPGSRLKTSASRKPGSSASSGFLPTFTNGTGMRNLLVLGRMTSGEGGEVILAEAGHVLQEEFPPLAEWYVRSRCRQGRCWIDPASPGA